MDNKGLLIFVTILLICYVIFKMYKRVKIIKLPRVQPQSYVPNQMHIPRIHVKDLPIKRRTLNQIMPIRKTHNVVMPIRQTHNVVMPITNTIIPLQNVNEHPTTVEYEHQPINTNSVVDDSDSDSENDDYQSEIDEEHEPIGVIANEQLEVNAPKNFNYNKKFASELEHFDNDQLYSEF